MPTTRVALKWGIALGVSVCLWTLALHALGWYTTNLAAGQRADQVALILPVAALFLALRERTRLESRGLRFGEALWTGLLTGWFSVPISAAFLWLYHHYVNPGWLEAVIAYQRDRLTRLGSTPEAITRAIDAQRASGTDAAQLIGAFVGTTIISLVIAAILWALFRLRQRISPR